MRIIQKQISLEPMTSRLPSIWPAYLDNRLYFFDDASLSNRSYQYTSNWGMVPVNIVVNVKPYSSHTWNEYSVAVGCHCYGGDYETNVGCSNKGSSSYDELCNFVLSFENLSKWYYFFTEYYNLLKQYSHCNRVYTSAEDYYNYESLTKYADQMIYGTDKETYLNLDKEFANKGGRVEVKIYNKDDATYTAMTPEEAHDEFRGDRMAMTDVYDVGFFKWICDNVVPSFTIPMTYRNYWKKDILFYPDVIKWMKWFNDRVNVYGDGEGGSNVADFHLERNLTELWDCKVDGVDDCCDCEEYFGRGGDRIYLEMKKWYKDVQLKILGSMNESCAMPTIILPTELQLSIDDLGEFSIFSKDYVLGEDYRVAHYGDSANTYGGTVATMDGRSIYLDKDGWGYTFNPDYMEKYVSSCLTCGYESVFAERCPKCGGKDITQMSYMPEDKNTVSNAWIDYTDRYINHKYACSNDGNETYSYSGDFYTNVHFYTYDENNAKYTTTCDTTNSAISDLAEQLSKIYPITKRENGWLLIGEDLYPIKNSEFCFGNPKNSFISGNTYLVLREEGTNTPYTFINGKKTFAEFYPPTNQFYFPFFTTQNANFEKRCSGEIFNINNYQTFGRFAASTNKMYYVEYNGIIYNLGTTIPSMFIIDGNECYIVSGYSKNENGEMLYIIGGVVKHFSDNFNGLLEEYKIEGYNDPIITNNNTIKIMPKGGNDFIFPLYRVDEITGKTISKLKDIRLYNVLTDDIGHTIEGIYDLRSLEATNHQPPQGTELELIYQVGNTANISRFSQTKEDMDEIIAESNNEADWRNYFVGDIITNMTFYYKDYNDEIVEDTIFHVFIDSNDDDKRVVSGQTKGEIYRVSSGYTSLSAITEATKVKNELEDNGDKKYMYDDIFCDITYYVGATLVRRKDKPYNLAFDDEKSKDKLCSNYGVEYTETVKFVKTNKEYYLRSPKDKKRTIPALLKRPCIHSVSYPIYVYALTQDVTRVDESQYGSEYSVPMADFRFDINVFSGGTNGDTFSQKYSADMATHNEMQVFPVFREEYRLGIATLENVNSNIYIDRGINAAFEKHLKLTEVTSIEALEQYGNGYFKMMEN